MRLLFLAEARSVHSQRWIRFFAERGHQIDWVSLSDADVPLAFPNLRFHSVTRPGSTAFRIARAALLVRRLVRDGGIDLVHAHYAGSYGLAGALAGFHPFVLTAWGSDVLTAGNSPVYGPLVRFAVRRADLITCDAEHLSETVVRLGAAPDRVRIVFFGTDTKHNHPDRASAALRERLDATDRPLVISARTLDPLYDVGTFVRAMPRVLAEFPRARFVVAGDGPQRAELERLAASLGLGDAVRFAGSLRSDALAEHLATADVYVSTSTSDGGLAATTAEAMACGTPVIITDFGQNREWVADGTTGVIIPIGDVDALASSIIRLLGDEALRHRFGAAGRAVIETRNDYHREMSRMEQIYQELVGSPAGQAARIEA